MHVLYIFLTTGIYSKKLTLVMLQEDAIWNEKHGIH